MIINKLPFKNIRLGKINLFHLGISCALLFAPVSLFVLFAEKFVWAKKIIKLLEPKLVPFLIFFAIFNFLAYKAFKLNWFLLIKKKLSKKNPYCVISITLALSIILFLFPVYSVWSGRHIPNGTTAGASIFGLIPYSDAGGYYQGAFNLIDTGEINEWNSRRPLNVTLLAVRFFVTNYNARITVFLQVLMLGVACFIASNAIAKKAGWCAGMVVFSILLAYSRDYGAIFLSEALGLTLGALAFSCLWHGMIERNPWMFGGGMFLQIAALLARDGAYLVLPILLLFFILATRKMIFQNKIVRFKIVVIIIVAVLCGFSVNPILLKIYKAKGSSHNNFSVVLYGMAAGGKGWKQFYKDYPEESKSSRQTSSSLAYQKSFELIKRNPLNFLKGYKKYLFYSIKRLHKHISQLILFKFFSAAFSKILSLFVRFVLLIGFLVYIILCWKRLHLWFMLSFGFGFFISLPFIYPDGGFRVIAATFPFIAALFGLALFDIKLLNSKEHFETTSISFKASPALIIGIGLVLLAMIGPGISHKLLSKSIDIPDFITPVSREENTAVINPQVRGEYIQLHDNKKLKSSFIPDIRTKDAIKMISVNYPRDLQYELASLKDENVLLYAYDYWSRRNLYLFLKSSDLIDAGTGFYKIWYKSDEKDVFLKVERFEEIIY